MGIKERREMEKQVRKNQILSAARNLMFSQGIEKTSISKIAKEAELGVGTIYFYFKNKEEIFIALQEEGISFLYAIILQIAESDKQPWEKISLIAKAYYDFSQDQKEYFNIISYFLSSSKIFFKEDKKEQIDYSGSKILSLMEKIVIDGNSSGRFEENEPGKFCIMFWGTIHGLIQFKKLEKTALKNSVHKDIFDYSVQKLIRAISV